LELYVKWLYQPLKGHSVWLESDWMKIEQTIFLVEDIEKNNRTKDIYIIDESNQTWTVKQLKKLLKKLEDEPTDLITYFDGNFNKHTKESGLGIVIYYKMNGKTHRIRRNYKVEGLLSNNESEYASFHNLLLTLEEMGVSNQKVTFRGDSLVVLNQLAGEWPCYEEQLIYWIEKIEEKMEHLKITPNYQPVERNENKEADQLAKKALEGKQINSTFTFS